jgi:hypothetical protein
VATSNDWGGTAELKAAFTTAGAFAIPDSSRDAAAVVPLNSGAYTVVTSRVGNTTGNATVEAYDLDLCDRPLLSPVVCLSGRHGCARATAECQPPVCPIFGC